MSLMINKIEKYGRFMLSLGIVIVALMSSGCATIVKGTKHEVRFESDPPGATVRTEGNVLGQTPFTTSIKGNYSVIEFQLAGYQTRFVNPDLEGMWRVEPLFYGNFLWILTGPGVIIGAPIGFMVDYMNGYPCVLRSPFRVTLYPIGSAAPANPAGLSTPSPSSYPSQATNPSTHSVADRLKSLKDLKDQGVINDSEYETKRAELMREL